MARSGCVHKALAPGAPMHAAAQLEDRRRGIGCDRVANAAACTCTLLGFGRTNSKATRRQRGAAQLASTMTRPVAQTEPLSLDRQARAVRSLARSGRSVTAFAPTAGTTRHRPRYWVGSGATSAAACDRPRLMVTPRLRSSSTRSLALGLPASASHCVSLGIASSDWRSFAACSTVRYCPACAASNPARSSSSNQVCMSNQASSAIAPSSSGTKTPCRVVCPDGCAPWRPLRVLAQLRAARRRRTAGGLSRADAALAARRWRRHCVAPWRSQLLSMRSSRSHLRAAPCARDCGASAAGAFTAYVMP